MLSLLEDHARSVASHGLPRDRVLQVEVTDSAPDRERLVRAAGYVPVRVFYSMVRPHLDDLDDAPLPEGFEIRDVRPEHMRQIWDAAIEAFRDSWNFTEPTAADYEEFLTDPVESDTSLWRVAWAGDDVAGSVRSFINAAENERFGRRRGWVEHISVRRPYRRRGLARALIAASFPLLRARGMTEAALGVDTQSQSNALSVYERCGFVVAGHETTYRKPLA
jgi:ribosomal protein S18 acetylase RimI-like enzyme